LKNIANEIGEFVVKNMALLLSLLIGITAKLAIDSKTKKLTKKDVIIKVVLSVFLGYVVGSWLESHGRGNEVKIYVPIATLMGESLVGWMIQNASRILTAMFEKYNNTKK